MTKPGQWSALRGQRFFASTPESYEAPSRPRSTNTTMADFSDGLLTLRRKSSRTSHHLPRFSFSLALPGPSPVESDFTLLCVSGCRERFTAEMADGAFCLCSLVRCRDKSVRVSRATASSSERQFFCILAALSLCFCKEN
ncbi:uncharacterized protein J3R85_016604 [Psidium guajava]|nr:uncharacterized protein J3R85_016604 [Psidium guajava]